MRQEIAAVYYDMISFVFNFSLYIPTFFFLGILIIIYIHVIDV